ncbi:MAG: hypothetical protein MZV64_33470 [Ignavibacteriales bacterium]|nr:hypothetical protein [Ignavibacteriales bacterium]
MAEIAVLNNNYLLNKVLEIRGASAPYAKGKRRIEQVRYSWEQLDRRYGRPLGGDRLPRGRLRHALLDQSSPVRGARADDPRTHRVLLNEKTSTNTSPSSSTSRTRPIPIPRSSTPRRTTAPSTRSTRSRSMIPTRGRSRGGRIRGS